MNYTANLNNSTNYNATVIHNLPAGFLPTDNRIELIGIRHTRKVIFTQNGVSKPFKFLPNNLLITLSNHLQQNQPALNYLTGKFDAYLEMLEDYTFCMWGLANNQADFKQINGEWCLSEPENFKCNYGNQCHCFGFTGKSIKFNNHPLTAKQIAILELIKAGLADKNIADVLGFTQSTLDSHKKKLFTISQTFSKTELITKAIAEHVIQ